MFVIHNVLVKEKYLAMSLLTIWQGCRVFTAWYLIFFFMHHSESWTHHLEVKQTLKIKERHNKHAEEAWVQW